MTGLDNLKKRLNYYGGDAQSRLINDKKRSLDGALKLSYQNATVTFQDERGDFTRQFKALINDDKVKNDYDNKIISMKYEDIQLNAPRVGKTTEGTIPTEIKSGQTFYWEESKSYWIIYLQYYEERAYFRAEIRRCEKEVEINGKNYKIYFRGPVETTIPTGQKGGIVWTTPNYSGIIYITKNEETLDFFHRFAVIKIDGKPWKVTAVDEASGDGIIEVQLVEEFRNTIKEEGEAWEKAQFEPEIPKDAPQIVGPAVIYPYSDNNFYELINYGNEDGEWSVDSKKVQLVQKEGAPNKVMLKVLSGRSGNCILFYTIDEETKYELPITIGSL